jgi:hypothetical protein
MSVYWKISNISMFEVEAVTLIFIPYLQIGLIIAFYMRMLLLLDRVDYPKCRLFIFVSLIPSCFRCAHMFAPGKSPVVVLLSLHFTLLSRRKWKRIIADAVNNELLVKTLEENEIFLQIMHHSMCSCCVTVPKLPLIRLRAFKFIFPISI